MKQVHIVMMSSALAVLAVLIPCQLEAQRGPRRVIVRIDDVPNGPPLVSVSGLPHGYDIYTGEEVATPGVEDGGIITLFGVDQFGPINPGDGGWRFVDPSLPADSVRNATDIVWIQHDWEGDGSLQIGFNTKENGGYYLNPDHLTIDDNAGPATNRWVTVYADSTLVLQFRPRTP